MDEQLIKNVVEATLLAAARPLTIDQILVVFGDGPRPDRKKIRDALSALQEDYQERGMEVLEVASGFRIQVKTKYTDFISRLWDEKPPRYSRALMETLALIAYRQPITRGEIEEVRGVSVSTNIIRSLLERNWVRVVGHRDVPGKPEMFGTTKEFLDYFSLKRLDDLPTLAEIKDIDAVNEELDLVDPQQQDIANEASGSDDDTSEPEEAAPAETETSEISETAQDGEEVSLQEAAQEIMGSKTDSSEPLPEPDAVVSEATTSPEPAIDVESEPDGGAEENDASDTDKTDVARSA